MRRNRRLADPGGLLPEPGTDPREEPEQLTEKILARRRLETALGSLPDEQRDAFLLREEGGLSIDDIALVSGVSRETAKSRLRYAVDKLRAAMAEPVSDET